MEQKVTGHRKSDFVAKDGTPVKGSTLFTLAEIVGDGKGQQAYKYFLTEDKIEKLNLDLDSLIGCSVEIGYNRWGKLDSIKVID